MSNEAPEILVPANALAAELGVNRRTIGRWFVDDPTFPQPKKIKHRLFWVRSEIEAWKAEQVRAALSPVQQRKRAKAQETKAADDGRASAKAA